MVWLWRLDIFLRVFNSRMIMRLIIFFLGGGTLAVDLNYWIEFYDKLIEKWIGWIVQFNFLS